MTENMILVDTDIIISILRREEPFFSKSTIFLSGNDKIHISCITYYECKKGYHSLGSNKRIELFNQFLQLTRIEYLNQPILDKSSEMYAFLKPRGLLRGEFDLLIGATAITNNWKLVTNNHKHYIPLIEYFGLEIANWN